MNNQQIFSDKEEVENENRKQELINHIASGNTVLLAGAGCSARLDNYPDWSGLLKLIEEKTIEMGYAFRPDKEKRENSPLLYAQEIKSLISGIDSEYKYLNLIEKVLMFMDDKPEIDRLHKTLVSLPFKGILTTNYDMILEAALESVGQKPAYKNSIIIHQDFKGQVLKYIRELNNPETPKRIAHLHGRYDHPKGIILSSADYQDAYGFKISNESQELKPYQPLSGLKNQFADKGLHSLNMTLHQQLLRTILPTCRFIFVGFSMEDIYFDEMLKMVCSDMMEWSESIHFAIMDISSKESKETKDKAKLWKKEYGVETVFYKFCPESDTPYQGLDDIIDKIAEKCTVKVSNHDISDDLSNKEEDVLDWLEKTNQNMEDGINESN